MSIVETKKFKIIAILASSSLVFGVIGSMGLSQYLKYRAKIKAEKEILDKKNAYDDEYREITSHIFQNLKLDHFLAAYKYLQVLPPPDHSDELRVQEYIEVLNRVGKGLLSNQLLKESEEVFQMLRNYEGDSSSTSNALNQIESKRKVESAHLLLIEGESLLDQKRYRDALSELQKSETEINDVEFLKFDDIKEDRSKLNAYLRVAKFFAYLEDAEAQMALSSRHLKNKKFKEAIETISKAARLASRAEFLRPGAEEVKVTRKKIDELDAEISYEMPNFVPIQNQIKEEDIGKAPYFFYLSGYDFGDAKIDSNGKIPIAVRFAMNAADSFFVVRYRISFFDTARDVFNGHFLSNKDLKDLKSDQIAYEQEIPEALRKNRVQRIEVQVFDNKDALVAEVSRAFRK